MLALSFKVFFLFSLKKNLTGSEGIRRKLRYSLKVQFSTQKRITKKPKTTPNPKLKPKANTTQLKILAFSSINLHGFLGISEFNRSDPDTAPDTLLACYLVAFWAPFPKLHTRNTDSCTDNTKWILLSPVLKCLPVPLTGKKKSPLCRFHRR